MTVQPIQPRRSPDSLADVLERVLDKGVVIVGDIVVDVLDIELLSIKLRLFVSSAQTAKEMGMDWWTNDPFFTNGQRKPVEDDELAALRGRVRELENQVRDSHRDER
jgi:gas vesicle protein GvpA/GvpJ/GvpM family